MVISEAIRSALGPRGMDKMLVDNFGDVVITNDGATILKEIEVSHPVAKFIVELSKSQDQEVGDGTTTVAVLAGELLKKAEELLDDDIHPTEIVEGYRLATKRAMEVLDNIAREVSVDDEETLRKVAYTSMNSKIVSTHGNFLAELVVKAVKYVVDEDGTVDIDNIKVEKVEGESIAHTQLVKGIVLDKEVVHPAMPKEVKNAKIALIAQPLEITKTEFDAEINITDPEQLQAYLDRETEMLKEMVEKIKATGANVILAQKGIDDMAQHFLAKAGIMAVRRVKKSDMEKLARATGAQIVTNLDDLSANDLGEAGWVHQEKVGDDDMLFVEECPKAKSVTILVRGGTELVVDEAERSIHDALCVVRNVLSENRILPGGGAPEVEVARALREYADEFHGGKQLAIRSFADALEVIPRTLSENGGLDPMDMIVQLRTAHKEGKVSIGVDPVNGGVKDMWELNIFEPTLVKKQAIKAASEAAQMILRIDDVIAAKSTGGGDAGGAGGDSDSDSDFD